MFENIIELDRNLLLFFNGGNSVFMDSFVATLTYGPAWIPLYIGLLYLVVKNNETMAQIGLALGGALLCVILAGGVDNIIVKPLVGRLRPCNDPMIKYSLSLITSTTESNFSFFSAHAANTMALAVFFCCLIRDRLLGFLLILWSLMSGWTRLYLGVHFPSDVFVGTLYGIIDGLIVYLIYHKIYFKFNPKLNYISSQYTSSGYAKSDIDVVLTIFIFTIAIMVLGALLEIRI